MIVECKNDFKSSRDTYSLDEYTDSPPKSIHSVFGSNSPRTVQTNCLQSTRYQIVWTVQLPDHPPHFYSPRQLFFLGENLSKTISAFDIIISPEPYKVERRLQSSFHQHASLWKPSVIIWDSNAREISSLCVSGWKTLKNVLNSMPRNRLTAVASIEFKPFFFVFSPDLLDIHESRWTERNF